MKNIKSEKCGIIPNIIVKKSLSSQRYRKLFNFKRIERSENVSDRLGKYNRKNMLPKRKKFLIA